MNLKINTFILIIGLMMSSNLSLANDFSRYAHILGNSSNEEQIIKQFFKHAAARESEQAMALLTSAIQGRETLVLRDFNDRLFPFFKDYVKIHNAKTIGTSVFPDGSRGTTHYIYIITQSGEKKPLMVSLRKEGGRSVILDIAPNKCVPNRHPSCDEDEDKGENEYEDSY